MLPKTAFSSDTEYLAYLRDWFAGQAPNPPAHFRSEFPLLNDDGGPECWPENDRLVADHAASRHAAWAYAYADAMLATRQDPDHAG